MDTLKIFARNKTRLGDFHTISQELQSRHKEFNVGDA